MPYLAITDFKIGMDRRRDRIAGTPGSLWTLKNAHITRGGDIERAKRFVPTYDLPAGTHGMSQLRGQLYVFGSANPAASMPNGVQYQRLQNGSAVMTRILDAKTIQSMIYAIARFDDGNIYHYYNGTRVSDWDALADANASFETLAAYMADLINSESNVDAIAYGDTILLSARTDGQGFTIAKSTTNQGGGVNDQDITLTEIQSNVNPIDEVLATCTLTVTINPGSGNAITSVTINGSELLTASVPQGASADATATALAAAIDAGSEAHTYTAEAAGNVVTVTAGVGTGATPNGYAVAVVATGTTVVPTNMSGGVNQIDAGKQIWTAQFIGTEEALDKFVLTVDGTDYAATLRASAMGTSAFISHQRVFSPAANILRYSKLAGPNVFVDATTSSGAGFIDASSNAEGDDLILVAAPYGNQMAVFSRETISLYFLSTDAEEIIFDKPMKNSGTLAARSPVGYGNSDLFYLDASGIRSLRARQGTSDAYVDDVGSPLDKFIVEHMRSLPRDLVARAVSAIEPTDNRLMLAVDDRIYVLSHFPNNKITAWSYYEPGFSASDFVRIRGKLYVRAGDIIYLYGGDDGETYPEVDEQVVEVELPYMSANTPATDKFFAGFDVALTNTWEVYVLPDPTNDSAEIGAGGFTGATYGKSDCGLPGETAVFALRLRCSAAGRASISSIAVHYAPEASPS